MIFLLYYLKEDHSLNQMDYEKYNSEIKIDD